jgi:ankyrin repeat protein
VKKGADINLVDDKKNNPFLIAVQHNHLEIVKYLIDTHHVDVNYTRDTVTALHLAA